MSNSCFGFPPEFPGAYWLRLPHYSRDDRDRRFQCRKTFELSGVPETVYINVTADAKYILYVNGQFVHFGPARGFQSHWPYDRLDIAPYLKCGKNVIAALVYKFGMGMTMYAYGYDNGFLLSGKAGAVDLSTGESWLIRHAPGYIPAVARSSGQYGFQEFFDCRAAQDEWFMPEYAEDESWFDELSASHLRAAGCAPWYAFEERGVPLLGKTVVEAAGMVGFSATAAAPGMERNENIYLNYAAGGFDWQARTIPGNEFDFSGEVNAVVADLGEQMPGKLIFDIDHAQGGEMLGFIAFETLKNDGLTPDFPETPPEKTLVFGGRLTLKAGKYHHETTLPWGVRYVVMWKSQGNFKVKLAARKMIAELDVSGSFRTSDTAKQKIWDMCMRSQRCCLVDSYIDCPGRENAQWWGDALVQSQNTFRITDKADFLARGLRQIGEVTLPDGLTYAIAPTSSTLCVLPDYSALYPVTLYAHYFQTGSLEMYDKMRQTALGILSYFRNSAQANGNGLAAFDPRYWIFLDWCGPLQRKGTPTVLNLLWLYGLKCLHELSVAAGDKEVAALTAADMEGLTAAIEKNLYDPASGFIADGLDESGKTVTSHSAHGAALAIILGLFPQRHQQYIEEILLPLVKGDRSDPLQPSVYFTYFVFEALKRKGYRKEVIECIDRWWGEFVEAGCSTTPELFLDQARKGHSSFCHAWGAHPLVHYSEILLGVRQLSAGWEAVEIDPLLIPGMNIKGSVPTPHGAIVVSVAWQDGKPMVFKDVPGNITVRE
ncbi:MAG: hypothetical protein E7053_03430 [Lentisphaerae bacterium]|nr:hypothetical protein [Lentisphaerota bacterium]